MIEDVSEYKNLNINLINKKDEKVRFVTVLSLCCNSMHIFGYRILVNAHSNFVSSKT